MINQVLAKSVIGPVTCAPIALFVFNRPLHTRLTIEALQDNELASESDLIIYSDAARSQEQYDAVKEVRAYVRTLKGFKSIRLIERQDNFGLAASIIEGVTELCEQYGKVIVLEDDMVTSRFFLRFMNDALTTYADDQQVASVHGYQYPVNAELPETFFLKGADCWGWATWQRAWRHFESDGKVLMEELTVRKLTKVFDLDGAYDFSAMLANQVNKKNNSWAIRWHASCYLQDMLTLYPGRSLVDNIGNDASGTHCGDNNQFKTDVLNRPIVLSRSKIEENSYAREVIKDYFFHHQSKLYRLTRFWRTIIHKTLEVVRAN